jgi:hypothetical protein
MITTLVCVGVFFFVAERAAATKEVTMLSAMTMKRGYTLSRQGALWVSIPPRLHTGGITVATESLPSDTHPTPDEMVRVSDVWMYDLLQLESAGGPLVVKNPISVSVRYSSSTLYRKRIFFWDANRESWLPLPSTVDTDQRVVRARTRLPFAHIAVFEDRNAVEGTASWFRHRYADSVASNDFPLGSTVRVTNLENHKSVTVVVRTRGPFVPGRVVDLSSTAFRKIQDLWKGVANVRAKLISL